MAQGPRGVPREYPGQGDLQGPVSVTPMAGPRVCPRTTVEAPRGPQGRDSQGPRKDTDNNRGPQADR